jgi:hypothetical protein
MKVESFGDFGTTIARSSSSRDTKDIWRTFVNNRFVAVVIGPQIAARQRDILIRQPTGTHVTRKPSTDKFVLNSRSPTPPDVRTIKDLWTNISLYE